MISQPKKTSHIRASRLWEMAKWMKWLKEKDFERKPSNLQKERLTIDGTQEFREITLDGRDRKVWSVKGYFIL